MRQSKKIHGPDVRLSSKMFFARLKAMTKLDADCMIWANKLQNGTTPYMNFCGIVMNVRRLIRIAQGKEDQPGRRYMSSCGNPLCVSPDHLVVISRAELNKRSAAKRNEVARGKKMSATMRKKYGKLTADQIIEMRAADGTLAKIAEKYGVHPSLASRIRRGEHAKYVGNMWL